MRILFFIHCVAIFACVPVMTGCENKKTPEEIAAAEEAKWRKGQLEKAGKYYRQLAEKYPDSANATEAKAKGEAISLELAPPPPKK